MDTKGGKWWWGGGGGGMNWEIGIDMYTLMCIKWMTNKNLLYKKMNKGKFLRKFSFVVKFCIYVENTCMCLCIWISRYKYV